ncbi:hypothetical protein ACHAXS_007262 [Conticribra weissflogii]
MLRLFREVVETRAGFPTGADTKAYGIPKNVERREDKWIRQKYPGKQVGVSPSSNMNIGGTKATLQGFLFSPFPTATR